MPKTTKPAKPSPDFKLTPRGDNRWQIKRKGKTYYFRGDAQEALKQWHKIEDDVEAGRVPVNGSDEGEGEATVFYLCKAFCSFKLDLVESGELAAATYYSYKQTCQQVIDEFGKTRRVDTLKAIDFQALRRRLAKGRSSVTLAGEIRRAKILFKYAYDAEIIDAPLRGVKVGLGAVKNKALRKERNEQEPKLFTADEVHLLLDAADDRMKCVVLLCANGGLGPKDLKDLQPKHIVDGVFIMPRGKTGVSRRIPLWQETLDAIDRVGLPLRMAGTTTALSVEFRTLLNRVGITRRAGLYWLRHCVETYGGEALDQVALDRIMGHADQSIAAHYRESIGDDRLRRVVDSVHDWLFGESAIDRPDETLKIYAV